MEGLGGRQVDLKARALAPMAPVTGGEEIWDEDGNEDIVEKKNRGGGEKKPEEETGEKESAGEFNEEDEGEKGDKDDNPMDDQAVIAMVNQCKNCNGKKKSSKDCQMNLDRAWFCMLLREQKHWWYSKATVIEISAAYITVFAHLVGKEKRISIDTRDDHKIPNLYVQGVDDYVMLPDEWDYISKSRMDVRWSNRHVENTQFLYGDERPELEETEGQVVGGSAGPSGPIRPPPPGLEEFGPGAPGLVETEEQEIKMLSVVPIVLIPTDTVPIDFVMLLVSPFHEKHKLAELKITAKEKTGFDFAPPEPKERSDDSDDDSDEDEDARKMRRSAKAAAHGKDNVGLIGRGEGKRKAKEMKEERQARKDQKRQANRDAKQAKQTQ